MYDIELNQIYSITTDNGRNYLKARRLIQSKTKSNVANQSTEAGQSPSDAIAFINCWAEEMISDDDDTDTQQNNTNEVEAGNISSPSTSTANESTDEIILGDAGLDSLANALIQKQMVQSGFTRIGESTELNADNFLCILQLIYCAAHIIQLCVNKALKEYLSINFLDRVREVVKTLRKPSFYRLLSKQNLRRPVLSVDTRWNSICTMVSCNSLYNRMIFKH